MEWIVDQAKYIYYILLGIFMLGAGMFISDLVTESADKLFKKD